MNDPIEKTLTVPLNPAKAFDLFTSDIDTWWPKATHSVTGAKAKVTFPTHKDGEIVEESADGTRTIWGKLIAYEPGAYLAFTWHPGRTEKEATVVTVTFTKTDEGTRCDLTHGGFDILGDTADAVSTSYLHGWDMVLGCYAAAVKAPALI
ncbi:SRPBCC domain-containing protein [Yoonia sp. GPGPB17]|uniref:SRPBCC domain-containing protein n=1 Tax=Yoonia sp. GPGPB17 TaxID=3026147 RepID=UPI0030C24E46